MNAQEFFAKFKAPETTATISTTRQIGTLKGYLETPGFGLQPNKAGNLIHDNGLGRFLTIKDTNSNKVRYIGVSKELDADITVKGLLNLPIYSGWSEANQKEWKTIGKASVGGTVVTLADIMAMEVSVPSQGVLA